MKKFVGKRVLLALGVVALCLAANTSTARAGFTIADLIAGTYTGPTLTGYDVLVTNGPSQIDFKDFGYVGNSSGGAITPLASDVTVTGVPPGSPDGNSGLLLTSSVWGVGPNQTQDSFISYDVQVVKGPKITDLHLYMNAGTFGTGQVTIDDTFHGSPGTTIATPGHPAGNLSDASLHTIVSPFFNQLSDGLLIANGGVDHLSVQKDINLRGGTAGVANLSAVFQTYSVPEPASFALVGMGLVGAYGIVRRRKATTA